mmetsp:Transcript_13834/g.40730  ORF Transcript_13834/g.40730 Transcript_13834/m.40730 type:complete len:228 (+) Transcript_13834:418-1101(+)
MTSRPSGCCPRSVDRGSAAQGGGRARVDARAQFSARKVDHRSKARSLRRVGTPRPASSGRGASKAARAPPAPMDRYTSSARMAAFSAGPAAPAPALIIAEISVYPASSSTMDSAAKLSEATSSAPPARGDSGAQSHGDPSNSSMVIRRSGSNVSIRSRRAAAVSLRGDCLPARWKSTAHVEVPAAWAASTCLTRQSRCGHATSKGKKFASMANRQTPRAQMSTGWPR